MNNRSPDTPFSFADVRVATPHFAAFCDKRAAGQNSAALGCLGWPVLPLSPSRAQDRPGNASYVAHPMWDAPTPDLRPVAKGLGRLGPSKAPFAAPSGAVVAGSLIPIRRLTTIWPPYFETSARGRLAYALPLRAGGSQGFRRLCIDAARHSPASPLWSLVGLEEPVQSMHGGPRRGLTNQRHSLVMFL